jgi:RNA polymerase sigma-70 factor (ECF subfamily)
MLEPPPERQSRAVPGPLERCPQFDAFDAFVAAQEPRVRRLAYRLLGWRGEVDDVVQDVFLAALKRLETFRGDSDVSTWLAAVTINRCRTYQRRQLLRLKWFRRRQHDENKSAASAADAQTLRDETNHRVREAIAALRAKDREVIVLFYLEELSIAEMAKLLGAANNAIEVRLHRARQRLKELLGDLMSD